MFGIIFVRTFFLHEKKQTKTACKTACKLFRVETVATRTIGNTNGEPKFSQLLMI